MLPTLIDAVRQVAGPGEIFFLHGLESSPFGTKAQWLHKELGATVVDLDTAVACESKTAADARGERWVYGCPGIEEGFAVPLARTRAAIAEVRSPKVVIGSSFGGAVLLRLLHEGGWSGPSVFIAGAGPKLTRFQALPAGVPAVLLHGRHDDVVPPEDSRALAATGGLNAVFWETNSGHRMNEILDDGLLPLAVLAALSMAPAPGS